MVNYLSLALIAPGGAWGRMANYARSFNQSEVGNILNE